jgi:hypothetical protein
MRPRPLDLSANACLEAAPCEHVPKATQEQETPIALLRRSLESLREADRGKAASAGDATS